MNKKQLTLIILVMVFGLFSTIMGCGPSGPKLYSIKGTATRNGKPLEKLYISFVPDDQNTKASATGVTDANGKFELEIGSTKGVYPGMHTVLVADPLAAVGGKSSDNPEYTAATKKFGMNSPLKLDIQKNESNLELKLD
jgi:hypothetical protein